jgi:hypothetical protein
MFAGMDSAASPSFPRPAESSPAVRDALAERPSRQRSRVTNGSKLIAGVDGRTAEARRFKDVAVSLADDLGGAAALTEAQRALVKQAASLVVQSESLQGAMLRGEAISDEQMTRVARASDGQIESSGIPAGMKM